MARVKINLSQLTVFAILAGFIVTSVGCADSRGGRFRDRGAAPASASNKEMVQQTLTVGGQKRTYYVHKPSGADSGRLALVLMFHGGRGDGNSAARMSGFSAVADKYGFVVAYPESTGNWRDGRESTGSGFEDIEFVRALIDELEKSANIDRKRVYSTGISNGGMFTLRLACDASLEIAAFAPVAASMPVPFKPNCQPKRPVPMLVIHGTEDGWVRWSGGEVRSGPAAGAGGFVIPVPETVEFWRNHNGCATRPSATEILDPNKDDGTNVEVSEYSQCKSQGALTLVKINGGGHTWPGTPLQPRRMVTRLVGPTSRDFRASESIWKFFSEHKLP